MTIAPLPFSAEPGFLAAASFGISVITGSPFRLLQGIRIWGTGCSVLIRNFNRSRPTFTDERSVAGALAGAYGPVNAVSLYVEHGRQTFHSVHVESATRCAAQAHRAGVERLAHVSGIGADAASQSLYIRTRGEGELASRAAFADALLIRPAVMFGADDAFLTTILKLLRRLPIYPMFGRGLQSAFLEDVAEAFARPLQGTETHAIRQLLLESYRSDVLRLYAGYWNAFECLVEATCLRVPPEKLTPSEKQEAIRQFIVDRGADIDAQGIAECYRQYVDRGFVFKASHALRTCFPPSQAEDYIYRCFKMMPKNDRLYDIRNAINHGDIDGANFGELIRVQDRSTSLWMIVFGMLGRLIPIPRPLDPDFERAT